MCTRGPSSHLLLINLWKGQGKSLWEHAPTNQHGPSAHPSGWTMPFDHHPIHTGGATHTTSSFPYDQVRLSRPSASTGSHASDPPVRRLSILHPQQRLPLSRPPRSGLNQPLSPHLLSGHPSTFPFPPVPPPIHLMRPLVPPPVLLPPPPIPH